MGGTNVVHRQYDDSDAEEGGKLKTFFSEFKDLGDQYNINYGRAINLASALYEQPSNLGVPMAFMASMTAVGSIHAKVKRGSSRGLLYRDIEYDINAFAQANRIAAIPMQKATYGIVNDRIFHLAPQPPPPPDIGPSARSAWRVQYEGVNLRQK